MVPFVPINPEQVWHTLPINVTDGNVGNNIDYSFVNMSNNMQTSFYCPNYTTTTFSLYIAPQSL